MSWIRRLFGRSRPPRCVPRKDEQTDAAVQSILDEVRTAARQLDRDATVTVLAALRAVKGRPPIAEAKRGHGFYDPSRGWTDDDPRT